MSGVWTIHVHVVDLPSSLRVVKGWPFDTDHPPKCIYKDFLQGTVELIDNQLILTWEGETGDWIVMLGAGVDEEREPISPGSDIGGVRGTW